MSILSDYPAKLLIELKLLIPDLYLYDPSKMHPFTYFCYKSKQENGQKEKVLRGMERHESRNLRVMG